MYLFKGERGLLYETWEGKTMTSIDDDNEWDNLDSSVAGYQATVKTDSKFNHPLTGLSAARLSGKLNYFSQGNLYLDCQVIVFGVFCR